MELTTNKDLPDHTGEQPHNPDSGKLCSHRVTRQTCRLLEGIEKDLEASIGALPGLRSRLLLYTRMFKMNEVELAAWAWVLSKIMHPRDTYQLHFLNLPLGAYHVKTLMCEDVSLLREAYSREDACFPDNYTYWLRVNPSIRQLSLEELNRSHRRLILGANVPKPVSTYTSIVETLVDAQTPTVAPTKRLFSEPNSGCFVYEREELDYQVRNPIPDLSTLFVKPEFGAVEKMFQRDFLSPGSVFR